MRTRNGIKHEWKQCVSFDDGGDDEKFVFTYDNEGREDRLLLISFSESIPERRLFLHHYTIILSAAF